LIPAALANRLRVRPDVTARPSALARDAEVLEHNTVSKIYRRLVLLAPEIAARALPGQFVMITVPGSDRILLPRPMAIHRRRPAKGLIEVIYGAVGRGTEALARVEPGSSLLVTGPLGRGYDVPSGNGPLLLLGRGIGICAFMTAAEEASQSGRAVTAVLSARTAERVIGVADCLELGVEAVPVVDADGSSAPAALHDMLLNRFREQTPGAILVCGSSRLALLASGLAEEWGAEVQLSIEAHMACGLGYCHGCAAPLPTDPLSEGPLVCVDGPVFDVAGQGV
jgi:dihydroorotate dehydrogenase electron transfer subunit